MEAGEYRKLPPNFYPKGKKLRYRNPVTGVMTSINHPLEKAFKLAWTANELAVDDSRTLEGRFTAGLSPTRLRPLPGA
jgi:hypothetical protein